MSITVIFWIYASVLLVSLISLVGVAFLAMQDKHLREYALLLVGLSTGALLGDVFLHIMPEMVEEAEMIGQAFLLVMAGILASFLMEKLIRWRHCHDLDCHEHVEPAGIMNLVGESAHNFIDGILIAGSFLVSIPVGLGATVAVILHEIPQELGDFGILVHSGFSKKQALFYNFLSALVGLVGATLVLFLNKQMPMIGEILLPITAGNFLYIAGADLIPELHRETRPLRTLLQFFAMMIGIGLLWALTLME